MENLFRMLLWSGAAAAYVNNQTRIEEAKIAIIPAFPKPLTSSRVFWE